MGFQPLRGSNEVLVQFWLVDVVEQLTAVVVIVRVAADGGQSVRRKCDEVLERKSPRDIFSMGIQSAILVDDKNGRQFRWRRCTSVLAEWPDEITSDVTVPIR